MTRPVRSGPRELSPRTQASLAPSGTTPIVAYRHRATSRLRARAMTSTRRTRPSGARPKPPRQLALRLMPKPAPSQLNQLRARPGRSGLVDSLHSSRLPARPWRGSEPRPPRKLPTIAKLPAEHLVRRHHRIVGADPVEPHQARDHHIRPQSARAPLCRGSGPGPLHDAVPFSLDLGDLPLDHLQKRLRPAALRARTKGKRFAVAGAGRVEPGGGGRFFRRTTEEPGPTGKRHRANRREKRRYEDSGM